MKSQLQLKRKVVKQPCKRQNISKVKSDKQALNKFREEIYERIDLKKMSGSDVQKKWDITRKEITKMADAYFGRQEKTVYKPWITGDILELLEEYRMCKVGGNMEEYVRLWNRINKEARRVREEQYEKKYKEKHMLKGIVRECMLRYRNNWKYERKC